MTQTHRKTYSGWIKDRADHRDYQFQAPRLKLPKKVDLRAEMPPVQDQGQLGSCTAHALVAYMSFLYPTKPRFSRLFVYYNERVLEGTVDQDAGAMIRDGVKTLNKQGACKESLEPYQVNAFTKEPSATAYKDALKSTVASYYRISSLNALKAALSDGSPVVFGFTVYQSFEGEDIAKTGIMPMPKRGEQVLGGHAVLAVGYDDSKQCVIVRNSWGRYWGEKGYFYMPYAFISNSKYCDDFWTMKLK